VLFRQSQFEVASNTRGTEAPPVSLSEGRVHSAMPWRCGEKIRCRRRELQRVHLSIVSEATTRFAQSMGRA
jgi:hypothetical protein